MKMKPLSLRKITEVTGGKFIGDASLLDSLITGVTRDSREVEKGSLFLCIPGALFDGHDFAGSAFASGAVCCLAERELPGVPGPYILVDSTLRAVGRLGAYYRGLFDIPVVGITGSVGKTTAKEMTAAVLSQKYSVLKTQENLNNELGVPLTLLSLREEHTAAVIEMGISDFGEMSRLAEMARPTVCLITVIGYSHLEALGSLEGVLRAKSEVFHFMAPDSVAVMNGDDELLSAYDPSIRKITFGLGNNNDFSATDVKDNTFEGVSCHIVTPDSQFPVHIPAYGAHMVQAALAAAAVGRVLGLTDGEIASGVASYATVGSRANVINTGHITVIDDCYNANPNSVSSAILSLCGVAGRRVAILGDMLELGADSDELHRGIGVLADKSGVDCLICCGDKAEFIYSGFKSSGSGREAWYFPTKGSLLSVLPSLIREGDTALVKASHGMHYEEITEELKALK